MDSLSEKLTELISQIQYMGGLESRLAEHLIANGVTFQQWIPVTERLPEQGQEVIVCFGNHPTAFASAMMFWSETHLNWQNATYWMPLPEPPSGERRTDA